MKDDTQDVLDALDALLEMEREALLAARLDSLAALVAEKERLMDRLAALDAAAGDLTGLRGKAERNQQLMDSAMRGIRSVASRLGTLRRLRRTLETYDRAGQRKIIATPGGGQVEKRA